MSPRTVPVALLLCRVHTEEGIGPRRWAGASRQTPPYRRGGQPYPTARGGGGQPPAGQGGKETGGRGLGVGVGATGLAV